MHQADLGVSKLMTGLSIEHSGQKVKQVLSSATRVSKRALDTRLGWIKVPHAMRATRSFDHGSYKASEFRNFTCFFGFVLFDLIRIGTRDGLRHRRVWFYWIYLNRALRLPKREFDARIDYATLKTVSDSWVGDYIQVYGRRHATYNMHLMGHAHEIHQKTAGKLPELTAYDFESKYGPMRFVSTSRSDSDDVCRSNSYPLFRRTFRKGTRNAPRQIVASSYFDTGLGEKTVD